MGPKVITVRSTYGPPGGPRVDHALRKGHIPVRFPPEACRPGRPVAATACPGRHGTPGSPAAGVPHSTVPPPAVGSILLTAATASAAAFSPAAFAAARVTGEPRTSAPRAAPTERAPGPPPTVSESEAAQAFARGGARPTFFIIPMVRRCRANFMRVPPRGSPSRRDRPGGAYSGRRQLQDPPPTLAAHRLRLPRRPAGLQVGVMRARRMPRLAAEHLPAGAVGVGRVGDHPPARCPDRPVGIVRVVGDLADGLLGA